MEMYNDRHFVGVHGLKLEISFKRSQQIDWNIRIEYSGNGLDTKLAPECRELPIHIMMVSTNSHHAHKMQFN